MITGKQATRAQQLLLESVIEKRSSREVVVIHHIIDQPRYLQLEVERRCPFNGIKFERIVL